ncbi:MAG TPA: cadherin-like beta sandwich domain-containing protein [Mucilaginibacter sp.]
MKNGLLLVVFIFFSAILNNQSVYSQGLPGIAYTTPQVYIVDSTITPLSPTTTAGTVFPLTYNTPATFTKYNTPYSIAIDGSNNVYTTNNSTGYLAKFNSAGTALFTVNTGDIQGSEVGVDHAGNIYVSQFSANSVLKYNSTGTLLAVITGFSDPYGIAFDALNNVYIANYLSGNILKIDSGTTKVSVYLTGFNKPYGITIDGAGNMYVGEQAPGDVVKVAAGTLARTVFASGFNNPRHLNSDKFGNIYVADYGNNAIKGISASGKVTAVISTGLSSPRQAAFDSSGDIFIANYGTNTLLKSIPTNYITSFSITPALPSGLSFNTSSGQITGVPVKLLPATTFTIKATYNTGATVTAPLSIAVNLPNVADLANLALSSGSLNPTYVSGTLNYTANVANSINSITVTPTTSDSLATVTVNGTKTAFGSQSASLPLNIGNNTITTTVTAQDGVTKKTYLITVNRSALSTALASLSISSGSLSPAFSSGNGNYLANVSNNVNSITLTPTAADPTAIIKVNGIIVTSGTPSASQPMVIGGNTILITITAANGTTTQSYSVTVLRAGSSRAMLSGMYVSSGGFSPSFSSGTGSYKVSVRYNITGISVTPLAIDTTVTIAVNGIAVNSGMPSDTIPLNIGNNTIIATVTAQDGVTMQSYLITVVRMLSTDASLSGLSASTGNFNQIFSPNTKNYTQSVPNGVTSIAITPTTNDTTATMTVNGIPLLSGTASASMPLNVGNNTITTVVTAQDGTTKLIYNITVNRALSSNSALASLGLSSGSFSTPFLSTTSSYTVNVANSVTSFTVKPIVSDVTAILTVNGAALASGTTSASVALKIGSNTITTIVTAQDRTRSTYIITVIRAPSSNAGLSNMVLNNGSLSPAFTTGTTAYTVSVSNSVISINIRPTVSDPTAIVTVNGALLNAGTTSPLFNLKVGNNIITTVVTAQDKVTKLTYTVTVIRPPSSNAGLSGLVLSNSSFGQTFSTATNNYTATVSNAITTTTIKPTVVDPTATITVNGAALASGTTSKPIVLTVGNNNIITIVITAQDGTTNIYTVTVNRVPATNAGLAGLVLSSGGVSPAFSTGNINYTASVVNAVTSVTVKPTVSDPAATVTVNGTTVTSGTTTGSIALNTGGNVIKIVVTAQDGITTKMYLIAVTRAVSSNASLSNIVVSSGSLSPAFSTGTTNYIVNVSNATTSLTISPILSDATATMALNGTALASGTTAVSFTLKIGNTSITTVITAQDKITKRTYVVIVVRAPSSNAGLSNLVLSSGNLSPTFATGTTNYKTTVANAITSIRVTPTLNDPNATVMINGISLGTSTTSTPITLKVGKNIITTVVTAQDKTTKVTYTTTVIRLPSSNATLTNLILNNANLSPTFAPGTISYTANVSSTTLSTIIRPIVNDPTATVTVNGVSVTSGSNSRPLPLAQGSNTITTIVTAQDGLTIQTYVVIINVGTPIGGIVGFSVGGSNLTQSFTPAETNAADSVANNIIVHQAVSPNGDGINDFLFIEGIENFPANQVTIFDRNGITIYNTKGYDNSSKMFDGHSNINGRMQRPGTYFYQIDFMINGKSGRKNGYFILKFS